MTRGLSGTLLTEFDKDHIVSVLLVKLEFDSGTQTYFTGVGTVDYLGDTYTGVGDFSKIDPVLEDKGIKMKGIRLSLQGVDTTIIDLTVNEAIQGRPATVHLAAFDYKTNDIIDGFELFSGYMDTIEMSRGKQASMVLTVESIMSRFDLPNVRRFTSEDHKERFPGDLFFDLMPKSNEAQIIWGPNTSGAGGTDGGGFDLGGAPRNHN